MSWMLNVVLILQIVAALVMIGLVLVQHGKGADMGASFGSGASGSLFGATGSANFLSRTTAVCAGVFFACTLTLAMLSNQRVQPSTGGSVLDAPAAAVSVPATGAAQIPNATSVTTVPAVPAAAASAANAAAAEVPVASPAASVPAAAASGAGVIPVK